MSYILIVLVRGEVTLQFRMAELVYRACLAENTSLVCIVQEGRESPWQPSRSG
jgi:hypothetical protein